MNTMRNLFACIFVMPLSAACDPDESEENESGPRDPTDESTSETSETDGHEATPPVDHADLLAYSPPDPLAVGAANMTSTVWSIGKKKLALTYASSHTCYISELHGAFHLDTDSVRVWTEGNFWYAEGHGSPGSFTINCFRKEFAARDTSQGLDGIVSWDRNGDPVGLGLVSKFDGKSFTNRGCYLTELAGPLKEPGDGMSLLQLNNGWVLAGTRGNSSPGPLRVSAVCVTWKSGVGGLTAFSPELLWSNGDPKKPFPNVVLPDLPCTLTRISGAFAWIGVWREGSSMFLGGESDPTGSKVGARCIRGDKPVQQI